MSNGQRVTWFAVVVAALAGCADNLAPHTTPETPTTGNDRATVVGHIVDTTGAPVAGASVTVRATGEHATADGTGAFVLDVPANTTLTLAATAPTMAPTLLQQFLVMPGTSASVEIPMLTSDHFKGLVAQGANPAGGVVAVALKSMSGSGSVAGSTVELTPSSLGRVMYAPTGIGMADPDPGDGGGRAEAERRRTPGHSACNPTCRSCSSRCTACRRSSRRTRSTTSSGPARSPSTPARSPWSPCSPPR